MTHMPIPSVSRTEQETLGVMEDLAIQTLEALRPQKAKKKLKTNNWLYPDQHHRDPRGLIPDDHYD